MSSIEKNITFIPYDKLPEARDWRVGRIYRVKMVIKQVAQMENGANFEVEDATSLEQNEARKRAFISDSGSYGGNV